jgi:lambda family phage tail tape measure protein
MAAQNEMKLIISADGSGAIAASKEVAAAYKTLGTQTVADIEAQKAQIASAYQTISMSGVASAEEIKHAEQAKTAAIASLNEDLVGKSQGWTAQIKAHWLGLAAGIGTAMMAVNKGLEFYELGAKALQTESAFKGVAASAHESAEKLLADWTRASAGTVEATELMQRGIKGMTQGLSGADMTKVWQMARQGAISAGMDVKEAGEQITNSIANNLPRAMVRFGLITKEQMQLINKAMASGVQDVHMLDIAYDNYLIKQAKIGPEVDKTNEALQRHRAEMEKLKVDTGKFLVWAAEGLVDFFQKVDKIPAVAAFDRMMRNIGKSMGIAGNAEAPTSTGGAEGSWGEPAGAESPQEKLNKDLAKLASDANKKGVTGLRESFEAWKVTIQNLNPQLLETDKRLNDINKEAEKFIQGKPGAAPGTTIAIPKAEVDRQVAIAEGYLQEEALIKNAQMVSKMEAEGEKEQEGYAKVYETLWNKVAGSRISAEEVAIAKIGTEEDKLVGELAELYLKDTWNYQTQTKMRSMTAEQYEDLLTKIHDDADRQRTALTIKNAAAREEAESQERLEAIQFQEKTLAMSPAQATAAKLAENKTMLDDLERYKAALEATGQTGDQVWLSIEQKIRSVQKAVNDLTADSLKYTGTFSQGFQQQMAEYTENAQTAFQAGASVAKAVTSSMEQNFMKFFDHTSKAFMNFHDLAISLMNDIENALIKALVVNPLISTITGAISGTSSTSPAGIGSLISGIGSLFSSSGSLAPITVSADAMSGMPIPAHEGGFIQRLHGGGRALKPGEVPIIAQTGEFMLRRSAVDRLGPSLLRMLNEGKAPGSAHHINVPVSIQGAQVSHADIMRLRSSIEGVCHDWAKARL